MEAPSIIQADVSSKISFAVARKALDVVEEQGRAVNDLIKGAAKLQRDAARFAVSPNPGPTETGTRFNTTA